MILQFQIDNFYNSYNYIINNNCNSYCNKLWFHGDRHCQTVIFKLDTVTVTVSVNNLHL